MKDLTVINHNGQKVVDSREVAEMIDTPHKDLLEKIRGYIQILLSGKFRSTDFFIESSYQDAYNRTHPCYLCTRKGCDMIANKLTGEKGVLFSAAYINKFHEMQEMSPDPLPQMTPVQIIAAVAKQMADHEQKMLALEANTSTALKKIDFITETIVADRTDRWREHANLTMNAIAKATGRTHQEVKSESYELLEQRAGCKLSVRIKFAKARMEEAGATKTAIGNYCKLDAIEDDKRLKSIYDGVVKELAVKYLTRGI